MQLTYSSTLSTARSFVIPLGTSLPSPTRHKHKPDLQLLSQPGAMQALTNRIHQRLQVQPTPAATSTLAMTAASASSFTCESKVSVEMPVRRIKRATVHRKTCYLSPCRSY